MAFGSGRPRRTPLSPATNAPPQRSPRPQGGGGSIFDRLTDSSQFTGAHKHRFDPETGQGRGKAGRTEAHERVGGLSDMVSRGVKTGGEGRAARSTSVASISVCVGGAGSEAGDSRASQVAGPNSSPSLERSASGAAPRATSRAALRKQRRAAALQGSIFDRLTDSSQFTGAHKHRFDPETGQGRGKAGRTEAHERVGGLSDMVSRGVMKTGVVHRAGGSSRAASETQFGGTFEHAEQRHADTPVDGGVDRWDAGSMSSIALGVDAERLAYEARQRSGLHLVPAAAAPSEEFEAETESGDSGSDSADTDSTRDAETESDDEAKEEAEALRGVLTAARLGHLLSRLEQEGVYSLEDLESLGEEELAGSIGMTAAEVKQLGRIRRQLTTVPSPGSSRTTTEAVHPAAVEPVAAESESSASGAGGGGGGELAAALREAKRKLAVMKKELAAKEKVEEEAAASEAEAEAAGWRAERAEAAARATERRLAAAKLKELAAREAEAVRMAAKDEEVSRLRAKAVQQKFTQAVTAKHRAREEQRALDAEKAGRLAAEQRAEAEVAARLQVEEQAARAIARVEKRAAGVGRQLEKQRQRFEKVQKALAEQEARDRAHKRDWLLCETETFHLPAICDCFVPCSAEQMIVNAAPQVGSDVGGARLSGAHRRPTGWAAGAPDSGGRVDVDREGRRACSGDVLHPRRGGRGVP